VSYPRAIDFETGTALVVTDLHGNGKTYNHVRDTFLKLHRAGEVDRLIICGDLIHGYGDEAEDASLPMLLDVMNLQQELGRDTVVMLMGNHEMPHVYSIPLSKGNLVFTPRFERALAQLDRDPNAKYNRADVMTFLKSLPFVGRTKAGVLITHAGASPAIKVKTDAELLLKFDHDALLASTEGWMQDYDLEALREYGKYRTQVQQMVAVDSPDDPRFLDMLRGQLLSINSGQFQFLWDVLFATNEKGWNIGAYEIVLKGYLVAISQLSDYPQKVIVAGHIGVKGGHELVTDYQLRLASSAHAHPEEAGQVLMLNCEAPIRKASQLIPHLRPTLA
jgi:hypothetical protein